MLLVFTVGVGEERKVRGEKGRGRWEARRVEEGEKREG
jgi:hypothetical protein